MSNENENKNNYDHQELLNFWVGDGMDCWESLWYNGKHPVIPSLDTNEKTNAYITEKWKKILDFYVDKNIDLMRDGHPLKKWIYTPDGLTSLIIMFGQFPKRVYDSKTYYTNEQMFQKMQNFWQCYRYLMI